MKTVISHRFPFVIGFVLVLAIGAGLFAGSGQFGRPTCDQKDAEALKKCWEAVVSVSMKKGDIAGAFDSLADLYGAAPNLGETCHSLTHEIGRTAYRLFARDVDFGITPKTAYCSYGFYHGFMEELVLAKGDMKLAREFCSYVDQQLVKVSPDVTLQCYHGIGHGTVNNHDPRTWGDPQKLIDPAIALCEEVATNDSEVNRCATGVYNGLAVFYSNGEYKLTLDRNDPVGICRRQPEKYQDACYVSFNTLLLGLTGYDLAKAATYLAHIPQDVIAQHAMINLASPVGTKHITETDHAPTISVCRSLPARIRLACIQGYAFGFLEHGEPTKEYIKPLQFCESNQLTTEEQNACFEYILGYLPRWYAKEKVLMICSDLNPKWKEYCEKQTIQ